MPQIRLTSARASTIVCTTSSRPALNNVEGSGIIVYSECGTLGGLRRASIPMWPMERSPVAPCCLCGQLHRSREVTQGLGVAMKSTQKARNVGAGTEI
jgi:hypothetical protein